MTTVLPTSASPTVDSAHDAMVHSSPGPLGSLSDLSSAAFIAQMPDDAYYRCAFVKPLPEQPVMNIGAAAAAAHAARSGANRNTYDPSAQLVAMPEAKCIPAQFSYHRHPWVSEDGCAPSQMLKVAEAIGVFALGAAARCSDISTAVSEGPDPSDARMVEIGKQVCGARTRAACELERLDETTLQIAQIVTWLRSFKLDVKGGKLHCGDAVHASQLYVEFSKVRDAAIVLVATLAQNAKAFDRLGVWFAETHSGLFTVDSGLPPCLSSGETPARLSRARDDARAAGNLFQQLSHALKVLAGAAQGFVQGLDRLQYQSFIGTLTKEFSLCWARIWCQGWEESQKKVRDVNLAWQALAAVPPCITF